jgi:hypothetical protein
MPRKLRFAPPGSVVEITGRTVQSRLFMTPGPEVNDLTLGVLGRAQFLTGMRIYGYTFLSNHYHLHLGPTDTRQLARFMCHVNGNIAREIGRLQGWNAPLFGRRYVSILISDEEPAQVGRLHYLVAHGCKEGFVGSPLDWPGVHCARALLTGKPDSGIWFDRTKEYNARRRGAKVSSEDFAVRYDVVLSPLPCWAHLDGDAYRRRIGELIEEIEHEAEARARETGKQPMGAARIRAQDPLSRPRRTAKRPAPSVHAISARARAFLLGAYREFVGCYRAAAARLARGDLSVEFPEHCFPPPWPGSRKAFAG